MNFSSVLMDGRTNYIGKPKKISLLICNYSAEVLSPPFVIPNEVRNPLGVLTLPFTCILNAHFFSGFSLFIFPCQRASWRIGKASRSKFGTAINFNPPTAGKLKVWGKRPSLSRASLGVEISDFHLAGVYLVTIRYWQWKRWPKRYLF